MHQNIIPVDGNVANKGNPTHCEKKIQKNSILGKNSGKYNFQLHHLIEKLNVFHFKRVRVF